MPGYRGTSKGADGLANGQVTATTTAGTLVEANPRRRKVIVKNQDSSIVVYVGIATVTALNGISIAAGATLTLETTALIQVIAASGTPIVGYIEIYD